MKLLIYLGHPAQYHFFKLIINDLQTHGHTVKVVIKAKDILEELLLQDGVNFENILAEGRKDNSFSIIYALLKRDYRMLKITNTFHPDILIGSDASLAHVGRMIHKPCITVGEDDYSVIKKLAWLMMPFSSVIVSPKVCNTGPWEYKKISYDGYMKLSYLHPAVFTPDELLIQDAKGSKYCIIRLAKLIAHHDTDIRGLNPELLQKLVKLLTDKGLKIMIDAEYPVENIDNQHLMHIRKSHIHHYMAFAELVISDSQSMSVEAALLGVPSIRFNDFVGKISVLEELEHKYELTYGISPSNPEKLFDKVEELLTISGLKNEFQKRREKMLSEKINVKEFMVWFIENYPQSRKQIIENPELQNQFK